MGDSDHARSAAQEAKQRKRESGSAWESAGEAHRPPPLPEGPEGPQPPRPPQAPERREPRPAVPHPIADGAILRAAALEKSYRLGRALRVPALRGLGLEVASGEFVAIVGPSGSGKTTLLNLAGLLDRPDAGEVWLRGRPTAALSEAERAGIRGELIGFVFQTFNLLPHLTAEENVALPLRYAEGGRARSTPAELLSRLGLDARLRHRPDELSGGEQQRVAIARALMLDPPLILADEPTGDLDSETARGILEILEDLRTQGKTLVVVTHNEDLAAAASRKIHVRDGVIVDDGHARRRAPRRAPGAGRTPRAKKDAEQSG